MRRRYRVSYEVTCFGYIGIYYDHKARRWFDRNTTEPIGTYSTHQRCRKFRKAVGVAHNIRNKFGDVRPDGEVVIVRWYRKNGQRMCQEFILPPRTI